MEEYDANVEKLGILTDELVALLPEEPTTELEAKVGELVARLVQHMEMLAAMETADAEDVVEAVDGAEDAAVMDTEAA